jgi:alpha-beta hydrolase superfamily lysophospholipase
VKYYTLRDVGNLYAAGDNMLKVFLDSATRIFVGVLLGISIVLSVIYMLQEKLIFFPQPLSEYEADRITTHFPDVENIAIKTLDNVTIRGWLVKASNHSASPLIIYFGGNAEEVSSLVYEAEKFHGWSLALINYRGYGLSEGKPGEKNLCHDAVTVYDYFAKRAEVDRKKIVVMGRSLGTGVAVHLADMRQVKGVILISPYDSLVSIAKELYPFLPVNLLLTHRFDSGARAPLITVPLLAIAASDDTIIPRRHSERLVEKWGGPHSLVIIEGVDHNTISDSAMYWKAIHIFLANF